MQPDTEGAEHQQRAAEEICRSIYAETATFYECKAPRVAGRDLGYRILYGPPVVRSEYLFLGYQPGGGAASVRIDQLRSWPTQCEYGLDKQELRNAGWENPKLALNMQRVWGAPSLKQSTGLNVIFFRAPNSEEWRRLETGLRLSLRTSAQRGLVASSKRCSQNTWSSSVLKYSGGWTPQQLRVWCARAGAWSSKVRFGAWLRSGSFI